MLSREIKFKLFDKVNNDMVDGCFTIGDILDSLAYTDGVSYLELENKRHKLFKDSNIITPDLAAVREDKSFDDDFAILPFTGLKDKNGKDIYGGYIVAYDTDDGIYCAEVKFVNDINPNGDDSLLLSGYILANPTFLRDYKENEDGIDMIVIGNIYENPELLEDKS